MGLPMELRGYRVARHTAHGHEFFAVVTETFFEKPKQLKQKRPELYEEMSGFYGLDPAAWGR